MDVGDVLSQSANASVNGGEQRQATGSKRCGSRSKARRANDIKLNGMRGGLTNDSEPGNQYNSTCAHNFMPFRPGMSAGRGAFGDQSREIIAGLANP